MDSVQRRKMDKQLEKRLAEGLEDFRLPQSGHDLSPGDPGKPGHATVIFWTPMKSSGSTL